MVKIKKKKFQNKFFFLGAGGGGGCGRNMPLYFLCMHVRRYLNCKSRDTLSIISCLFKPIFESSRVHLDLSIYKCYIKTDWNVFFVHAFTSHLYSTRPLCCFLHIRQLFPTESCLYWHYHSIGHYMESIEQSQSYCSVWWRCFDMPLTVKFINIFNT